MKDAILQTHAELSLYKESDNEQAIPELKQGLQQLKENKEELKADETQLKDDKDAKAGGFSGRRKQHPRKKEKQG